MSFSPSFSGGFSGSGSSPASAGSLASGVPSYGKKLLVTGAAGFIGARFVEFAQEAGYSLISVDDLNLFDTRPEHAGLQFGTRVDLTELEGWIRQHQPDLAAVIHLGACSDTMELDWRVHERLNLDYSRMLWNLCTERKVPFVYASSAATYGEGESGYADDETQMSKLQPLNPYGKSKLLFDLWALEQEKAGRTPPSWAGFKFFNVFGFGERHKGRMASIVLHSFDQIWKTGKVKLFESHRPGIAHGHQKRDFIHVDDVVQVLQFAWQKPLPRGVYNLGTGVARTFLDLTRAVFSSLQRQEEIEFIPTPESLRERYQYFTQAEMQKLRAAGYERPFLSLEDGVDRTVKRLQHSAGQKPL
jgi:ADP-L-glycero-D-manno-heptose 6-epimerase